MATKKKMLQAAAGNAAAYGGGAGGLNVEQVFSTYLYDGNGSSQVIENGINLGQSNDGGSVHFTGASYSSFLEIPNSTDFTLGDYYSLEANIWLEDTTGSQTIFGRWYAANNNEQYVFYVGGGGTITGGVYPFYSQLQSSSQLTSGRWYHVLFSFDGSSLRLFIDGALNVTVSNNQHFVYSTGNTPFSIGGNSDGGANFKGHISNVRVRKFTQSNQVPTSNFNPPTSDLTADAYTVLLTCQGDDPFADNSTSAHTVSHGSFSGDTSTHVTQSGFGPFDAADAGEGGLVWIKDRLTTRDHMLNDTERGADKSLSTNRVGAPFTNLGALTSFNSNGFTLGAESSVNALNSDFTSWTFRKAPKFFTCLTYTGTGDTTTQTISHDLGAVPGCIIVKRTDSADNWRVYHRGVDVNGDSQPWTDMLTLNSTNAASDFPVWGDTAPTSTEFTVGYESSVNASGGTYVAYLFAHNDGDGDFGDGTQDIIKCGSYTGNGSSTGPEIDLGFEPQWLLVKRSTGTEDWMLFDSMRGIPTGSNTPNLRANKTAAEIANINFVDLQSTGFQPKTSLAHVNNSGDTYIYIAIRRGPMAVPTDATDVFQTLLYTGNATVGTTRYTDITVDALLTQRRTGGIPYALDRVRGGTQYLATNSQSVEGTQTSALTTMGNDFLDMDDGPVVNGSGNDYCLSMWRRAPSFCDVVAYTGSGTAGDTVSHNLGVAPEMMWIKQRNGTNKWVVYHSAVGNTGALCLDDTSAINTNSIWWNNTSPTENTFALGANTRSNGPSDTYIAYLFASLDGVSKVGSFTGDGTSGRQIDCGFSSGARFILIKATSTTGGWLLWDAERGIVTGNDPYLFLSSTSPENTGGDNVDPYSAGFIVNGPGNNASGVDYIFYAIA